MSLRFPYTYISCPCSDKSRRPTRPKRWSRDLVEDDELEGEEKTFDSRHPRSQYSIFPPEHLLYCEECHDIKCPRCVTEEIICWYCPSCLFETPSSMVRSEGNRCARNCFNCPICQSVMVTSPIVDGKDAYYILNCNYCMWTTLDIGIKFDKPTNIRSQLDKVANGGGPKEASRPDPAEPPRKSSLAREPFSPSTDQPDPIEDQPARKLLDHHARFSAMRTFYKDQIASAASLDSTLPTSALDLASYSSPSSIARIMNLYTNLNSATSSLLKRSRQQTKPMREALSPAEGLRLLSDSPRSATRPPYSQTPTPHQILAQNAPSSLGNPSASTTSLLRPLPTHLRTKRAKRCLACKHILTKPEFKPSSTRYRIRLLALNYIPLISLRPVPTPGGPNPVSPVDGATDVSLPVGKASQWILTMRNPLFERVKVSLGCPAVLQGKRGDRVTILCPEFEIGRNSDVWDDALGGDVGKGVMSPGEGQGVSAGRVYESGRNWVGVVVEVVPGLSVEMKKETTESEGAHVEEDEEPEDADVIEVPIRVRLEWRVSEGDGVGEKKTVKTASEKLLDDGEAAADVDDEARRELAYWMVIGIGRVAC